MKAPKPSSSIVSIIGFGSQFKGDVSAVSDIDLVIVVEDSMSDLDFVRLEKQLESLEDQRNLNFENDTLGSKMLGAVARQTGMFVSHFVCRKSDFTSLRFSSIFHTNRFLTRLLSPTSIVTGSALSRAQTLYGSPILEEVKPPSASPLDVLKSVWLNLLLSIGAAALTPATRRAFLFSLEACKWSAYAVFYVAFHDSPRLTQVVERLINAGIMPTYLKRFQALRINPQPNWGFVWLTPIATVVVHLSLKRLVKKGSAAAPSLGNPFLKQK